MIAAAAVVVIAVLFAIAWPGEKEPEYQRKKLSEWLDAYQSAAFFSGIGADQRTKEAEDAVRHIGTNALPWLLRWLKAETPGWRLGLSRNLPWQGRMERLRTWLVNANTKAEAAVTGFEILGEQASAASPQR